MDNVVDPHIDQVGGFFIAGVSYGDDFVIGVDEAAFSGGTAGHNAHDFGVAFVGGQHGADAGELHVDAVDVKILGLDGAHIIRVRIKGAGEGAQIHFEFVVQLIGLHSFEQALVSAGYFLVACGEFFGVGFGGVAFVEGQDVVEHLELDAGMPEFARGAVVFGPRFLGAQGEESFIFCKIEFAFQEFIHPLLALGEALEKEGVDFIGGAGVAHFHVVIEGGAVFFGKGVHIGLQENHVAEIQQVEVAIQVMSGDFVVEAGLAVMDLCN